MTRKDALGVAKTMVRAHGEHAGLFVQMQISRCEADGARASAAGAWRNVLAIIDGGSADNIKQPLCRWTDKRS